MKINKFKKKKNGLYELDLDDGSKINVYDDIILKYDLLIKKEISNKILNEIIFDNNKIECYNVALKYISVKLRTEKEIRKKLINYSREAVTYTIKRLQKEGYLNNLVYIKAYINDEVNLKLSGPKKILNDLKKEGFKEEDILDYLNSFAKDVWLDKINKYTNKKINSNHNLAGLVLKNKIINDLLNKGFYIEDINTIINEYSFVDNEEIREKEYNKLKNKLIKKYSGEELEYQIKIRLMKKGFKKN